MSALKSAVSDYAHMSVIAEFLLMDGLIFDITATINLMLPDAVDMFMPHLNYMLTWLPESSIILKALVERFGAKIVSAPYYTGKLLKVKRKFVEEIMEHVKMLTGDPVEPEETPAEKTPAEKTPAEKTPAVKTKPASLVWDEGELVDGWDY
jgi:hypothetical protein